MVIERVEKRWENIAKNIKILKKEFFVVIKLVLKSIYFSFNKKFYRQVLSSPLLQIIANIIMEDLEEKAFQLSYRLLFYFRYVDDILLAAPPDSLTGTLEIFNSFQNAFNSRLK